MSKKSNEMSYYDSDFEVLHRCGYCDECGLDIEEIGDERSHLGSHERFSAHFVDQGEGLEEACLARDCLLEGAGDHFLDGEVEDVDGAEAGEGDPMELFEQAGVWPAGKDETSVCIADQHNSPDETEEEGVEVGRHNHVPREGEQLAPTTEVKKWVLS